jgi:hypothetical protein
MTRSFDDPQSELEFIAEIEAEFEHLESEGLVESGALAGARESYGLRRTVLESALSGGSRMIPDEALARSRTAGWVAALGVASVVIGAAVFAVGSWDALGQWGRGGVLALFAAAFFVAAHLVYRKTRLRRSGLALLLAANAVLLGDIYHIAGVVGLDKAITTDGVATLVASIGVALACVWYVLVREQVFLYMGSTLFVLAANAGGSWLLSSFRPPDAVDAYPGIGGSTAFAALEAWLRFAGNVVIGGGLVIGGWLAGKVTGWRVGDPYLLVGSLTMVMAFSSLSVPDAGALSWWGWLCLAVSAALLWFGLSRQRLVVTVPGTIGFVASLVRLESEFFHGVFAQTVSLLLIGGAVIGLALVAERRRGDILRRVGGE